MKYLQAFLQKSIFFCAIFLCTINAKSQDSPQERGAIISPDISNSSITSFAEDSYGHIWIGTLRGVNRYNAYEYFQYISTQDTTSISGNKVYSVFKDSKNQIWICSTNGVDRYTELGNFKRIQQKADYQNIAYLVETPDGKILGHSPNCVAQYNPQTDKFDVVISDYSNPKSYMQSWLVLSSSKDIWLILSNQIRQYDINYKLKNTYDVPNQITYAFNNGNSDKLLLCSFVEKYIFDTRKCCYVPVSKDIINHPSLSKAMITQIVQFGPTTELINTLKNGIYLFNSLTGVIIHQSEPSFPFDVPNYQINTLFIDSQKNLWIGTKDQGFVVRYSYKERFNNNSFINSQLHNKSILSIKKDSNNNIWMVAGDENIYFYNPTNNSFKTFKSSSIYQDEKNPTFKNKPEEIFIDSKGKIWVIGAWRAVQCTYNGNNLIPNNNYFFPDGITRITEDSQGRMWFGSLDNTIHILNPSNGQIERIPLLPKNGFTFTNVLKNLSSGEIILGNYNGKIYIINPVDLSFKEIEISGNNNNSQFFPTDIYEDSENNLWISTHNEGVIFYNTSSGQKAEITEIACKDATSVTEDIQGNIWISTLYGLTKYDRTTQKTTNYYKYDGIGGNQFNERASGMFINNTLYFGGTHGLTYFNPIDVNIKRNIPFTFEYIKIDNEAVNPAKSANIDKSILYKPMVVLNSSQTSFSVVFSALDYSKHGRIHYSYILEGFDKDWNDLGTNREAYFSNLKPGKYTLKVKIRNNDNTIVEKEDSMEIYVKPAIWQTWWAKILELILLISIIYLLLKLRKRLIRDKEKVIDAERHHKEEARINKMNMSYFANISHEFRTPLTLISGPIEQLCNNPNIKGQDRQMLQIVNKSVNRMLRLVNQLMDFNRLENDSIRLKVKKSDIISPLKQLIEVFKLNASSKGIALNMYGIEGSFQTWMDWDKIDKIISNLVSNAIKFTPNAGKINIKFDVVNKENAIAVFPELGKQEKQANEYIKISVSDTGNGIPNDKLEKIFEKYYQVENHKEQYNWGTGIGLYYSRALIKLHHGYIKAENRSQNNQENNFSTSSTGSSGSGAIFTFIIPSSKELYTEEEIKRGIEEDEKLAPAVSNNSQLLYNTQAEENASTATSSSYENASTATSSSFNQQASQEIENKNTSILDDESKKTTYQDSEVENKKTILIVDDDIDIVNYIKTLLCQQYNILCAFDAINALKAIKEEAPDLILCDVVMPGKTGYDLCKDIKEDLQICHIPVILVTAKTTIEDQVEGLNTGADAYVTKPFSPSYLSALIQSQLKNRDKTKKVLSSSTKVSGNQDSVKPEDILSPQDKAFMNSLYELMENELSNTELNITTMTEALKISRTKLYYKVKGLTGENPNVFFKTYKLNRAAEILKEGKYNISEIADMVGFSTLPHFSQSFKKQFGVSPSDYK